MTQKFNYVMARKYLRLPIFSNEIAAYELGITEKSLSAIFNGDCYLLYSFADFLHKRGLMKALTLSEAKQIIFDFDNDEGGTPQADTPEQKNAHNED